MNRNQKISIIGMIGVLTLAVNLLPLMTERMAEGSGTISLGIAEMKSAPKGYNVITISDQQLANLPSISKGLIEADKIFNSQPTVTCFHGCPLGLPPRQPVSYMGVVSSTEAGLALSSLEFKDILRPGDVKPFYHGVIVEYNGKYYSISLIGI